MGQDRLREFDIGPPWLLPGPGDTPGAHGETIDRERFGRLVDEVERINSEPGLAPSARQVMQHERGMFRILPGADEENLQQLDETLRTSHGVGHGCRRGLVLGLLKPARLPQACDVGSGYRRFQPALEPKSKIAPVLDHADHGVAGDPPGSMNLQAVDVAHLPQRAAQRHQDQDRTTDGVQPDVVILHRQT